MRPLHAFVLVAALGCVADSALAREQAVPLGNNAGAPFAHTRFCLRYPAECRPVAASSRADEGPQRRRELIEVNARVNRSITPEDQPHGLHGEKEDWVISPRSGDCNDYAVTKRHELIQRGWDSSSLLLAEVVVQGGEHHLVLVARTNRGDVVLDNLNANVRPWSQTQYKWVRVQSPNNPLYWQQVAR